MESKIFNKEAGIRLLFLVGLLLLIYSLPGPRLPSAPHSSPSEEALAFLQARLKTKLDHPKRYDKPDEAQEFYARQRVPPGETAIPVERYGLALQHMERMPQYSTSDNRFLPSRQEMEGKPMTEAIGAWQSLGPGNVGGRTRALLIDPGNPNTMYAAGVAGGVWKSTNAGSSWTPLTDLIANLAVSSLAMSPDNSSVIYAGTGEGFFNLDAVRGAGIFKTTNGGTDWTQLVNTNNSNFYYVNDLVVSHNDPDRVYAATQTGIWRSTNGGANWTQVHNPGQFGGCLDLAIRTDQANDYIFASCGTFDQAVIYRNTNAGGAGTWDQVYTEAVMGRTTLAIAPSNQDIIYALSARVGSGNYNNGLEAVFRSTSSGDAGSWTTRVRNTNGTKLNTLLLSNPVFASFTNCGFGGSDSFLNQGWYDNVIAVDPLDPDRVWVGGIDLFRSDDGGANWGMASHWWVKPPSFPTVQPQYAHADQHTIVFHPQYNGTSNQTMFVGNDGGIFRTNNARAATATGSTAPCGANGSITWTDLNNNYGVTQFYYGVPYPNGTSYFGGTQDNGTVRGTDAGGSGNWTELLGGDGGAVAVDSTNTNILYAENTNLSIQKSTNGGVSFTPATSGISGDSGFLFIAPFIMDPSNSQTLWTGGLYLWRTTNSAASWQRASAITPGAGNVSALAVAPTDSNYVLAGMGLGPTLTDGGEILRTQNGLSTGSATVWANIRPANGYVSSLTFDPVDKNIAYATYSTFGVDHVWKSTNAGATWTAIDKRGQANGIPDIPAHSIAVDPTNTNRLFVGTDLGLFVSIDGGANWAVENTGGFANVVVEILSINKVGNDYTLFAFTHGRGVYRVFLPPPSLTLAKTASSNSAIPGHPLTYTLTVTSTSSAPALNILLTDTVPASTTLIASSLSGATFSGTGPGSVITWTTGVTLAQNEALSRTFAVTVTSGLASGSQIVNTAYASATNISGSQKATITATVAAPHLTLTKSASADPVPAGTTLTYTLSVANNGDADATEVTLTDPIPANTTYVPNSASNGGIFGGGQVSWTGLAVDQGAALTRTFQVVVGANVAGGALLTNTASVASAEGANDSQTLITTVENQSNLTITKTLAISGVQPLSRGAPITYTIIVANDGSADAANVRVVDTLPIGVNGPDLDTTVVVTAGETLTFTISATVAPDAPLGATITNTAVYSHVSTNGQASAAFTTEPDTIAPTFPITDPLTGSALITPTRGVTVTTQRPVFDWYDAADNDEIAYYTLVITNSSSSLALQASTQVTTTQSSYTPTVDLATAVYTWTVQAHDLAGNASAFATPENFVIAPADQDIYLPAISKDN